MCFALDKKIIVQFTLLLIAVDLQREQAESMHQRQK